MANENKDVEVAPSESKSVSAPESAKTPEKEYFGCSHCRQKLNTPIGQLKTYQRKEGVGMSQRVERALCFECTLCCTGHCVCWELGKFKWDEKFVVPFSKPAHDLLVELNQISKRPRTEGNLRKQLEEGKVNRDDALAAFERVLGVDSSVKTELAVGFSQEEKAFFSGFKEAVKTLKTDLLRNALVEFEKKNHLNRDHKLLLVQTKNGLF